MDQLNINGPCVLSGNVNISRAKNSSLPLMTATLLTAEPVTLTDLPQLRDIATLTKVLEGLGTNIKEEINDEKRKVCFQSNDITNCEATYDVVRKMRASILVLGPLVARFKKAKVSLPGGCAIGTRPIDIHLKGLEKLGAKIKLEAGYVFATAPESGLQGCEIELSFPSVGATENLLMACALAKGKSVIKNAAKEPEITDLCDLLNKMGAKITGGGTDSIEIDGVSELHGCEFRPIADRIEAATFVLAGLATKSEITISDCNPAHIKAVLDICEDMGAKLEIGSDYIKTLKSENLKPIKIKTGPYPEFPTDVQAQMMSFLLTISGESEIEENIFENRYMHVSELKRMGAKIKLDGNTAYISGGKVLSGAPVMCTDLRASAALVIASLFAKGESVIARIYHLERGYETLDEKLQALNADVKRIPGN